MKVFCLALSVALALVSVGEGTDCNFPPSLWCSSPQIAAQCQVSDHCLKYVWPVDNAEPVNVTLYYESLCPGCRQFIDTQLTPTYNAIGSIMNIELVPYGNAHEVFNQTTQLWDFECQHGEQECVGNLIEVCAMHILNSFPAYFPFISCMEKSSLQPSVSAQTCGKKLGIDLSQIMTCANGSLGNQLEHQMAQKTDALQPPHQYVPWIVFNGVHTEVIQNEAQRDLLGLVCKTYKGTKPEACDKQNYGVCLRPDRR